MNVGYVFAAVVLILAALLLVFNPSAEVVSQSKAIIAKVDTGSADSLIYRVDYSNFPTFAWLDSGHSLSIPLYEYYGSGSIRASIVPSDYSISTTSLQYTCGGSSYQTWSPDGIEVTYGLSGTNIVLGLPSRFDKGGMQALRDQNVKCELSGQIEFLRSAVEERPGDTPPDTQENYPPPSDDSQTDGPVPTDTGGQQYSDNPLVAWFQWLFIWVRGWFG